MSTSLFRITVLFLVLGGMLLRGAPDPAGPVVLANTEKREITSAAIGQRYELLVSLPADYAKSGKSYPVLYVLDGWHFPYLAFLQNNNLYSGQMPPLIIVNVSHPAGVNPMPLRARDFTPTRQPDEPTSGGAPAFLKFFADEVIPYVERTYRTIPADRALLGHSYGGLFALYALEQRPDLFQRIVAASPVVEWDNRLLFAGARERLKQLAKPVRLDLSAGGVEEVAGVPDFAKLLDELKPTGLAYRFTLFPGENHNSVRLVSFVPGLTWVYAEKP